MKKKKRNRRASGIYDRKFLVFGVDTGDGWRIIREIDYAAGMELVADGRLRRVRSMDGRLIGFQLRPAIAHENEELLSHAAITARENFLNAGTAFIGGRSRTAGLSEEARMCRVHPVTGEKLPPEDDEELIVEKLKAWARPATRGGDRAVRVYPKVNL